MKTAEITPVHSALLLLSVIAIIVLATFHFQSAAPPPDYKQGLKPHPARLSDNIISNPAPNKTYAGLSKKAPEACFF